MFDAEFDSCLDRRLAIPGTLRVEALARSPAHGFAKAPCDTLTLLAGWA